DEPYALGYHILVNSNHRCEPIVRWQPGAPFAQRVEFMLIFHSQLPPLRAWWFAEENSEAAHIEPEQSVGRHLEILDGGRYVHKLFEGDELTPERHLGIAWIWSETGVN